MALNSEQRYQSAFNSHLLIQADRHVNILDVWTSSPEDSGRVSDPVIPPNLLLQQVTDGGAGLHQSCERSLLSANS